MSLAHGSLGRSTTRVCFDKVDASLISRPDLFLSLAEKLSVPASDVSAPEGGNKVHLSFPSEQDAEKFTEGIVDLFQISESDNQVLKLISYSNERPTGVQCPSSFLLSTFLLLLGYEMVHPQDPNALLKLILRIGSAQAEDLNGPGRSPNLSPSPVDHPRLRSTCRSTYSFFLSSA
eukprot:RCo045996